MRHRLLPIILVAITFIGIVIGFYLSRTPSPPEEVIPEQISELQQSDQANEMEDFDETDQLEPVEDAVPNPDLTVNDRGLSKASAVIITEKGNIRFKFYPNDAPKTVNRIIQLINDDFYNGLTFHRVEPGFVVQGGDPTGTGAGGSGQQLPAEFNSRRHVEGTVAMARATDPNSADSQFYITMSPQPHLDRNYTIFGQVVEGMDVVKKIQPGDRMLRVYIDNED